MTSMSELTKAEKKLSRELIEKGVQTEFANALKAVEQIIKDWENKKLDNREAYHRLYGEVKAHDKHIAVHYDGITGSRYLDTVAYLLINNLITPQDIDGFQTENRQYLLRRQML
jgi:hypothetical protein